MATYTITGAFGYSGRYVAQHLLAAGHTVRTLTRSPQRSHPFGSAVEVFPLDFDDPDTLARACEGSAVLVPQ